MNHHLRSLSFINPDWKGISGVFNVRVISEKVALGFGSKWKFDNISNSLGEADVAVDLSMIFVVMPI
jgi:hypothetical protein